MAMKKIPIAASSIVLIAISFYFLIWKETKVITIAYTTDLQGFVTPHEDSTEGAPLIGGLSVLATYIQREKKSTWQHNSGFFLVDTGNFFAGQAEGYFFKGSSMIEIMNKLKYDALVAGPKDFVFGKENLINLAKEAKFPFLGANIVRKDNGEIAEFLKPYIVKNYKGIKIGFIGITTSLISSDNIEGLRILEPAAVVKKYVSLLKSDNVKADLIIILSNLGLEEDKKLAYEVSAIDVIIGGNDPGLNRDPGAYRGVWPFYTDPKNKTVIVDSIERGIACYSINIAFNKHKGKVIKYQPKTQELWPSEFKPDSDVQAIIQKYKELIAEKKKELIGYALVPLMGSKDQESTLGNWIADILRKKTKADIAFVSGLKADLKQADITVGDVYGILPIIDRFDVIGFSLSILELEGEQIKEMLENGVSYGLEKGEGILQVSGLKYSYDLKRKKWDRIAEVTVNGEKLDLGKTYKVALNGYLAAGLGGYTVVTKAKKRYDTGLMDFDVLVQYIKEHSPVTAPLLEGRIQKIE